MLDISKHTITCASTKNLKHNLLSYSQETIVTASMQQLQT